MQSKYSCSQSQGNARLCLLTFKINKQTNVNISEAKRETQFPQEAHSIVDGHDVIRPEIFFFFGGGEWANGVDERSKSLNFDCIIKVFFVEHNYLQRPFQFTSWLIEPLSFVFWTHLSFLCMYIVKTESTEAVKEIHPASDKSRLRKHEILNSRIENV